MVVEVLVEMLVEVLVAEFLNVFDSWLRDCQALKLLMAIDGVGVVGLSP